MSVEDAALLNPALLGDDEDENDPRRRLMQMMSLRAMQQLRGDRIGEEDDNEGTVGGGGGGGSAAPVTSNRASAMSGAARTGSDLLSTMTGDDASDLGIRPPGFDSNGMQTEFPATASKNAAADRLKRAQDTLYPTGNDKLKRALQILGPAAVGLLARGGSGAGQAGAVQGANQGAQLMRERMLNERNFAQHQYEFEASEEEKQREAAIRERLAMSTLEANKAYRLLTTSIAKQRADTGAANAESTAQGRGLTIVKGPDGASHVIPLDSDSLSALNKAKLGLQQAQANLDNAREKAIPEQVEIAKNHLIIQQQMLQMTLKRLELSQDQFELSERREDFRETGPTPTIRTRAQTAATLPTHIQNFRDQVNYAEQRHWIGPAAGRAYSDFLAGRIGSTGDPEADYFLGQMRTNAKLLTGAALLVHFNGRGISLYGGFENMLGAKHSGEYLQGTLDEFDNYMKGYQRTGDWEGADAWNQFQSLRPGQGQGPASRLKKSQPNSRTGNSETGATPPAGAKIRDYRNLKSSSQANTGGGPI